LNGGDGGSRLGIRIGRGGAITGGGWLGSGGGVPGGGGCARL